MIKNTNALQMTQGAFVQIDMMFDVSSAQQTELKKETLKKHIPQLSDELYEYYCNIFSDEEIYTTEYNRLLNNERINAAIRRGENTFESTIPCSSTKREGKACGKTLRYISNRGCVTCQKKESESKADKNETATTLIKDYFENADQKKGKSELIKQLINFLDIKKSAAYRLVNKYQKNEALYTIPKHEQHSNQSTSTA
ncbi:hypothetical protein [Alteromonas macleodii]